MLHHCLSTGQTYVETHAFPPATKMTSGSPMAHEAYPEAEAPSSAPIHKAGSLTRCQHAMSLEPRLVTVPGGQQTAGEPHRCGWWAAHWRASPPSTWTESGQTPALRTMI